MCDGSKIIKERQKAIRREMDRRGITLKAVAFDSGISYSTLATYFPADPHKEPVQIPQGATFSIKQAMALPLDIMNLLQPDNVTLVALPKNVDLDDLARRCREFLARKDEAHTPDSPAGRDLSDCETAELIQLSAHLSA